MPHRAAWGPGRFVPCSASFPREDLQHTTDGAIFFTDLSAFQLYCEHTLYMYYMTWRKLCMDLGRQVWVLLPTVALVYMSTWEHSSEPLYSGHKKIISTLSGNIYTSRSRITQEICPFGYLRACRDKLITNRAAQNFAAFLMHFPLHSSPFHYDPFSCLFLLLFQVKAFRHPALCEHRVSEDLQGWQIAFSSV